MTLKLIKSLGYSKGDGQSWAIYKCSYCGEEKEKRQSHGKRHKSCGCAQGELIRKARTIHGDADLRNNAVKKLYKTWLGMKVRCYNPKYVGFKYWGGKGIKVCAEWLNYMTFKEWALSNGYKEGLTIDRLDDEKDYSPSNCQWLTKTEHGKKSAAKYDGMIGANKGRERVA